MNNRKIEDDPEALARYYTEMAEAGQRMLRQGILTDPVRAQRACEFCLEMIRLHPLLARALTNLREKDAPTYFRIATAVQAHHQEFLDFLNESLADDDTESHLDARIELSEPTDLIYGGLTAYSGCVMRAGLIEWLKNKPSAAEVVPLLDEIQTFMLSLNRSESTRR